MNEMAKIDFKFSKKPWRHLKRSPLIDIFNFLFVIGALTWLVASGTERLGYNWQWYRVPQYIFSFENEQLVAGPLIDGLIVTFKITGFSLLLALIFGAGIAVFLVIVLVVIRVIRNR